MKPLNPILTVELFPLISIHLLRLLQSLSFQDWQKPTPCPSWTVKDVVAHLVGGNIGRLASSRDKLTQANLSVASYRHLLNIMNQFPQPTTPLTDFDALVDWINLRNAEWNKAAKHLTSSQLIPLLEVTDAHLYHLFKLLPPDELTTVGVLWAGQPQSPNWFDIAREYTEKWHHQQHIRQAVNQPGLTERRWLFPVLDTFMRALPYTYRRRTAPTGTVVCFTITGDAGGEWSLLRKKKHWALFSGVTETAVSWVHIEQDTAWRLFTKEVSKDTIQDSVLIEGDRSLGSEVFNMVSIMA